MLINEFYGVLTSTVDVEMKLISFSPPPRQPLVPGGDANNTGFGKVSNHAGGIANQK